MPQVFTCTNLELVRAQMNQMWNDADYRKSVQPEVEVVKTLSQIQTAKTEFFNASDKKAKLKVYWVEACEGAVQDCTTDCDFSGTPVSSECQDYEIGECKETVFTLDDSVLYDDYTTFNEAVAEGLMKHTTLLDNEIEKFVIAQLDSFASANKYTNDDRGNVVGNTTYIDGPFWTPSLMAYFSKVRRVNHLSDAVMFSGENMYDAWWNVQNDAANANGQGAKNKFDAFGWFFDLVNMDDILAAKKTLMVSPHAAAFVSTNRVLRNEEITNGADIVRFSVPSLNIPGVTYDVYYRTECLNGGEDTRHHWRIVARYDLFANPEMCDSGSGILSFECGTAP